jgi:hypothetical protein
MNQVVSKGEIEVRVEQVAQLFDSLDPFPFLEKDLDKDAEEYIVGWARELPRDIPISIIVHLPAKEAAGKAANELGAALDRYFDYRADIISRDLNDMFRLGRVSLAIGVVVLAGCLTLSQTIPAVIGTGPLTSFAEESLIILGWVANWKPIQIFLYDWWPLLRRRNLYRRLASASVTLRPY